MHRIYDDAIACLEASGAAFTIHEHVASHTVADAETRLKFPIERFLKTIAFKDKAGANILAGVRGRDRIDYRLLARAGGTKRSNIAALSPDEVIEAFDVEVGSVGPLVARGRAQILFDTRVPTDVTVFCGIGRADRTLEIRLTDLIRITGGQVLPLARAEVSLGSSLPG